MTAAPLTDDPVLVAFAEEVGEAGAVTIAGARTRWQRGGALAASTRILHAPSGVVWHQPEEMTVCVLAGTPVAELSSALADRRQRCALPEHYGDASPCREPHCFHRETRLPHAALACQVDAAPTAARCPALARVDQIPQGTLSTH